MAVSRLKSEKLKNLAFALSEQGAMSIGVFCYTAALARHLPVSTFGAFAILWAAAVLAEGVLAGFFGDAAAAALAKDDPETASRSRFALLILSFAGSLGVALVISGLITAYGFATGYIHKPVTLACLVLVIASTRASALLRKMLHVDQKRAQGALAGVAAASVLLFSSVALVPDSLELALLILSVASLTGALVAAISCSRVCASSPDELLAVAIRTVRAGGALSLSTLMSWVGNLGLLPVLGSLLGLAATAQFRIAQTMLVPASQYTVVAQSFAISHAERSWHGNLLLFASGPLIYSLIFIGAAPLLLPLLFGELGKSLPTAVLVISLLGYCLESIKFSYFATLIARGETQLIPKLQLASLITLIITLPVFISWGISGVAFACALANNLPTFFVMRQLKTHQKLD